MKVDATVIGASGFVGRRLTRQLQAGGQRVFAPERGDPELFGRDLGVVFYCAGLTADYDQRPFDTVEAHASLVGEIIGAGRFERLVYCSSTRLYDGSAASAPIDESNPLVFAVTDPRRVYDLSKALGENLTLARSNGRGSVVRLANVYDWEPGASGFLSEWLAQAQASRQITLSSSPNVSRDYIHLDDVVRGMIAVGRSPEGVFNLASGACVSNGEIAEVFRACGWDVMFDGAANPPPPPTVSVERLRTIGVQVRPVRDVVRAYLEGLKT